jgi:cyclic di-GMP phosphodiesterase Gmr
MTEPTTSTGLPLAALEQTAALILVVDPNGHIVAANDAALAAIRKSRKDAVGLEAPPLLTVPRETVGFIQALRFVARTGLSRAHEHEMTRSAAGLRSLAWSTSLISSDPPLLACVGVDVSAARSEAEDLLAKAQTDELTGLSNRAHLIATLSHMQGSGAAVLFCDLNGFKAVNDAHGHAAGDAVLVEVARRLRRVVRG